MHKFLYNRYTFVVSSLWLLISLVKISEKLILTRLNHLTVRDSGYPLWHSRPLYRIGLKQTYIKRLRRLLSDNKRVSQKCSTWCHLKHHAITYSAMLTTGLDQHKPFHYCNSLSTQKHSLVLLIKMTIENSPSGWCLHKCNLHVSMTVTTDKDNH